MLSCMVDVEIVALIYVCPARDRQELRLLPLCSDRLSRIFPISIHDSGEWKSISNMNVQEERRYAQEGRCYLDTE